MPSILDPQGQANTVSSAAVARPVPTVDPALFERGRDQQLQTRNQELISSFLRAYAGSGETPLKHHLVTLAIPHSLGPQHFRICSCGCIAGPYRYTASADVEGCQVQQAERMRDAHLKTLHSERIVQSLLQLSQVS